MRLVSYTYKKSSAYSYIGALYQEKIIDLNHAYRLFIQSEQKEAYVEVDAMLPANPDQFYAIGLSAIDRARQAFDYVINSGVENCLIDQEQVVIHTPVPNPAKIICVGKNYADHVAEMKSDLPEYPVLFAKFTNVLIGPEDAIVKSKATDKLDYEAELTIVIGKEASSVSEEDALDYVAGFTIGNDVSARDLQKRTPQWLQGKTLDRSTPVGPWVVTRDEISDMSNLDIKSFVNGELRQSSNTEHLIFTVPYLISFISNLITLKPGDIILTGTPDGVGFAMDPPQFLKDGDTVKVEIEEIGVLENRVEE